MIDPSLLRGDPQSVASNFERRGFRLDIDKFALLDASLSELRQKDEALRAKRNEFSKRIAELGRAGEAEQAEKLKKEAILVSYDVKQLQSQVSQAREEFNAFMLSLPNLLDPEVPDGRDESDSKLAREVGELPEFGFAARDHVELGEMHRALDFDSASRMSQARFVVLAGAFAGLHRALAQFMVDLHVQRHGYAERYLPYLVNTAAMTNTGQLPKFGTDDEFFSAKMDDLHLIPTSEVSLANLYAGKTFSPAELPLRLVAHSPCFRREAGSYGKDTRGMLRQHQFDKVELVVGTAPEDSATALEELTGHAEAVLQELELPYRVVELCAGDIGNASARTYDLEVWLPGQQAYREISSCSNVRDFQARRMGARMRAENKSKPFIHLLNGSGVAVGRAMIAVLENNQQEDGSVKVPQVLQRYLNGTSLIKVPA